MIVGRVHKSGNEYLLAIPKEQLERLGFNEGDVVETRFSKLEDPSILTMEQRNAIDKHYESFEEYLKRSER